MAFGASLATSGSSWAALRQFLAAWRRLGPTLGRFCPLGRARLGEREAKMKHAGHSGLSFLGQSSACSRSAAVLCHLFHTPCARRAGGGGFLQENEGPEGSSGGFRGHFWLTWVQKWLLECQVGAKMGQVGAKMGQDEAKLGLRWAKLGPRWGQDGPRWG